MRLSLIAVAALLVGTPALAAPLTAGDKISLEGVWRMNDNKASDACGRDGKFQYGIEITIEFKMTGGEIYFEDQAEGSGGDRIVSASKSGDVATFEMAGPSPWKIRLTGKNTADFDGRAMTHCEMAAPRSNMHLAKDDVRFLATGLVPSGTGPYYGAYFVDSRDPGACKAKLFQGLVFDLRSPISPGIARYDSEALRARLKANKPAGIAYDGDGMGRWIVEGVVGTATGWRFAVTELIPPNGSRGDMSSLDVMRTKTGIAIPAWKRTFVRCSFPTL